MERITEFGQKILDNEIYTWDVPGPTSEITVCQHIDEKTQLPVDGRVDYIGWEMNMDPSKSRLVVAYNQEFLTDCCSDADKFYKIKNTLHASSWHVVEKTDSHASNFETMFDMNTTRHLTEYKPIDSIVFNGAKIVKMKGITQCFSFYQTDHSILSKNVFSAIDMDSGRICEIHREWRFLTLLNPNKKAFIEELHALFHVN